MNIQDAIIDRLLFGPATCNGLVRWANEKHELDVNVHQVAHELGKMIGSDKVMTECQEDVSEGDIKKYVKLHRLVGKWTNKK